MDPISVLAAVAAGLATLLIAVAVGRPLLARRRIAHQARRFLDLAPADAAPSLGPERPATLAARLAAFAAVNRANILFGVLALALLVIGSTLFSRAVGVLFALIVVALAIWRELRRRARRRELLEVQLVPGLRLMASALESGYSVVQALERVVNDSPAPISEEFALVTRSVELGTPFETALAAFAERGEEFEFFATIVAVQYRVGGDLPSLLASMASTAQERLNLRAEVRALTAQARYSGLVLTLLPFVVLGWMLLVSPTYIAPLFTTQLGQVMLAFAGLFLVAGLTAIRTISHVEL